MERPRTQTLVPSSEAAELLRADLLRIDILDENERRVVFGLLSGDGLRRRDWENGYETSAAIKLRSRGIDLNTEGNRNIWEWGLNYEKTNFDVLRLKIDGRARASVSK